MLVFNFGTKSAANMWGKGRIMRGMDFYAANGGEGHPPVMTFCPGHQVQNPTYYAANVRRMCGEWNNYVANVCENFPDLVFDLFQFLLL